jgi:hypothetical protein
LPCVMCYRRLDGAGISGVVVQESALLGRSESPAFTLVYPANLCALSYDAPRRIVSIIRNGFYDSCCYITTFEAVHATNHSGSIFASLYKPPPSVLIQPRMTCSEGQADCLHPSATGANSCIYVLLGDVSYCSQHSMYPLLTRRSP